ncbi:MAG TPA: IS1595 family transposase [Rhizomicrobium sp.]|jgi:transposase-like protein
MASSILSASHFQDEKAAFAYVEARFWPNGPVCPFCGETERVGRLSGATTRPGLCKCYKCRKPFTVRMGTIFESSHLELCLWLQVIHLMCASKKGISTRQIQRLLNCSMKTAWFLTHRIREAMKPVNGSKLGGEGSVVEADETFLTNSPKTKKRPGYQHKVAIMSLVERGGRTRSFVLPRAPNAFDVKRVISKNVEEWTRLVTDGAQYYMFPPVAKHESVNHSKREYVRGDVHVNTLEGYFSVFKRGMIGTYQKVSERHMQRYVTEFDFRQNTREKLGVDDVRRSEIALDGFKGRRLTYPNNSCPRA